MVVIVGCLIVLGAVLVGFSMAGGHVGALVHPSEFVTIGGASLGALVIMSPVKTLKDLARGLLQTLKGSPYNKKSYAELFKLLYSIGRTVRREGLLALEAVVGNPHGPFFKKFPSIDKNHHAKAFLCDALSVIADGKADPKVLAAEFEEEIHVIEKEHHAAAGALSKTADGLPGFGIVAAVLGIVVTMQAIGGPVEEIGHKVGAALVGTFLGILMSYGFFAPLAARMEALGEAEATFYRTISSAVVAISEGESPRDIITRARRSVATDCRPTQAELTQIFKDGEAA
jgi:chemotaxis protein MotA